MPRNTGSNIPDNFAKWLSAALVLFFGLFLFVSYSLIDWIPPIETTKARMYWIESRTRLYWAQKGSLPNELSLLPKTDSESRDNSTKDEWGNEIVYTVNGTNVTLSCKGKKMPSDTFDVTKPRQYEQWLPQK